MSVLDSQSTAEMSLTVFGAMNEWQNVIFFKRELNRLLVAKMFMK